MSRRLAAHREGGGGRVKPDALLAGESLHLDVANQWLRRGEEILRLRPKSFAVLCHLAEHRGRLVSKQELLDHVWAGTVVVEAALTTAIRDIRRVLGDDAGRPWLIETVHRRGYRMIGALAVDQPPRDEHAPVAGSTRAAALVGRGSELERLRQWWEATLRGERRVVFVSGEPGIGKTALVDAFLGTIAGDAARIGHGQCVEQLGAGEAYLPVLAALGDLCRAPDGEALVALLRRHAPAWLGQMSALRASLNAEEQARLALPVAGATPERMLREMTEALEAAAAERPFVLVLEDLHWSDSATLDLLAWLARRRASARLLVLGTYRPADVIARDHPLRAVKHELHVQGRCEELALGSLDESAVADHLSARFGALEDRVAWRELARSLHARTDGIPLFVVSVIKDLLARGAIARVDSVWWALHREACAAALHEVPASLRQMIERQFERLSGEERAVLEAGAVAGAEFSAAAAGAALEIDAAAAESACEALARREQWLVPRGSLVWPDGSFAARYGFVHALYRDVIYRRISPGLRARLHLRIAQVQQRAFGSRAGEIAAELALHFEEGRSIDRAVHWLQAAADNAIRRSAAAEAVRLLNRALALLATLPSEPARDRRELAMQTALGAGLTITQGYVAPAVEDAYARAWELCRQTEDLSQTLAVGGLYRHAVVRGDHRQGLDLAQHMLRLAERAKDHTIQVFAHSMLGMSHFWLGELADARAHLEQSRALYDFERHRFIAIAFGDDPQVATLSFLAFVAWLEGFPDQALEHSRAALEVARALDHPAVLTLARALAAQLHRFRRDGASAQREAGAAHALAVEHGLALMRCVTGMLHGWARVEQEEAGEGSAELRASLEAYRAIGADSGLPHYLAMLAEAQARCGHPAEGLEAVREALEIMDRTGERWWEAELHRLRGELMLAQGAKPDAAEAAFRQAIRVARLCRARSLDLRATLSLARLWRDQNRKAEAQAALGAVYAAFSEGFATRDLAEAASLLSDLKFSSPGAPALTSDTPEVYDT